MSRILLVEDDAGDVDLIREAVQGRFQDLKLKVVPDGLKALEALKSEKPDLVVLDLNLPRKDGREVLKEIKQNAEFQKIPVAILSTSDSLTDIDQCYRLGANCYLTKPTEAREFMRAMRALCEFWLHVVKRP